MCLCITFKLFIGLELLFSHKVKFILDSIPKDDPDLHWHSNNWYLILGKGLGYYTRVSVLSGENDSYFIDMHI